MVQTVWNATRLAGRFHNLSQQIVNHPPKESALGSEAPGEER